MTEAEWLACGEPRLLLESLPADASIRKLRLVVCACYHRSGDHQLVRGLQRLKQLVHDALDWAQDAAMDAAPGVAQASLRLAILEFKRSPSSTEAVNWVQVGCAALSHSCNIYYVIDSLDACSHLAALSVAREEIDPAFTNARTAEPIAQAALIRDIFGNPYRSVTLDPSWLTPTVVRLAEHIYQERAFDQMPILADALQDAECDNADILNHCRQPGEHVRGCWVIDTLLGKA